MTKIEKLRVTNLLMDHMTGQLTLEYIDDAGIQHSQSGLSLCGDGTKLYGSRERDPIFFELLFECVHNIPEHKIREIKSLPWEEIGKLRRLLHLYVEHVGNIEGVDFLSDAEIGDNEDLKEIKKIVERERLKT